MRTLWMPEITLLTWYGVTCAFLPGIYGNNERGWIGKRQNKQIKKKIKESHELQLCQIFHNGKPSVCFVLNTFTGVTAIQNLGDVILLSMKQLFINVQKGTCRYKHLQVTVRISIIKKILTAQTALQDLFCRVLQPFDIPLMCGCHGCVFVFFV